MRSLIWDFIRSKPFDVPRPVIITIMMLGSVLFSLPRVGEGWFVLTLITYPFLILILIVFNEQLFSNINQLRGIGASLIKSKKDKQIFEAWWQGLSKKLQIGLMAAVGLFLGLFSLAFNQNPFWSRYLDALGIFYIGFLGGKLVYFITLIPQLVEKLKDFELDLNSLDPANTKNLALLVKKTIRLAILAAVTLLFLNVLITLASRFFSHLRPGVVLVSLIAWIAVGILTIYPHFIFWEIISKKKRDTFDQIDQKINQQYDLIINNKKGDIQLKELFALKQHIMESKSSPITGSGLIGVTAALLLNLLPTLIEIFF